MGRRHIPGAVFVFVSGGGIAIARGYGFAELDPGRPVDPARTIFRLASVSKTITATAALQLVERGQLDLHRDVNTYLKGFRLAATHGPITLHHLLTHTAGFDERLTGIAARSAEGVLPLSHYLARTMPPTFVEPGRVISYSNHGLALVGLLVEQASGRPFADYVDQHVFEPLGMLQSGSLTGFAPIDLAVAYEVVDVRHRALVPEYLQTSPSGMFFTTGIDMGRFLLAHLRGGAFDDRRILRPETVSLMHSTQFTQTAATSGWAYGFWEDARDGYRALLHNGGGKGYRALIYLIPQQDIGFFLAYNLADQHEDGELLESFITHFRRRFIPAADAHSAPLRVHQSPDSFVGDYLYVRRARTTPEKMIAVVNRVRIDRADQDSLVFWTSNTGTVALTPVGPRLFRRVDGRGLVAFGETDHAGRWLTMIADSGFPAVYERIPLVATLRLQVAWIGAMAVAFLYAAVWGPIVTAIRRSRVPGGEPHRRFRWLSRSASALNLVFLIGFPWFFLGRIEGGVPDFVYGVPMTANSLFIVPPVSALLAVGAAVALVPLWRDRRLARGTLVTHTLVVVALLAFVAFARFWRLL
jgi:CubicO group peptidase (beta-lactamase class C family)